MISELLGRVYESSPYILAYLKSPLNVAFHLAHRIGTLLAEYKKVLISLILYAAPTKNFKQKSQDGQDYFADLALNQNHSNLSNILGSIPNDKVAFIRTKYPQFTWDTNLRDISKGLGEHKFISTGHQRFCQARCRIYYSAIRKFCSHGKTVFLPYLPSKICL